MQGELAAPFGCNLFVVHFSGVSWEQPRYITALGAIDDQGSSTLNTPGVGFGEVGGDWTPDMSSRTSEAAPDGGALTFMSTQDLTGYATGTLGRQQPAPGAGAEVFVYDYAKDTLSCASCAPDGEPPDVSVLQAGERGYPTYLPVSGRPTFMRRLISADGTRVYFDSSQQLTPHDNNRVQDVYEWEQGGTGSCPVSTSAYGGCVFLLSGGNSSASSFFADASSNGEDVFLVHRGSLDGVGQPGSRAQLYDLRAGGGDTPVSVGCTGTGCQSAPPTASIFAVPVSATLNGVGNFPPAGTVKKITKKTIKCTKDKRLSRGKCVKVKTKRKVKKLNHGRGIK